VFFHSHDEAIEFGPFRMLPAQRVLMHDDVEFPLGGRAFDILHLLLENAGEIVSQRQLSERAWPGLFVEEANLRVHIANLRKSLADRSSETRYIQNVPRRGYCFVAPVTRVKHQIDTTIEAAPPPCEGTAPAPTHLPVGGKKIIGRDSIVAELADLLGRRRFLTLVGAGGIGKTTVALAITRSIKGQFGDAAFFIDLGELTDEKLVVSSVATALGLTPTGDNVLAGLLAFLRERRALLLLDNCEHLVGTVAEMAERIYAEAPQVFILATSREALRVEGETVHLLDPLAPPPRDPDISAEEAMRWPAIQLFMERAFAAGHASALSDEDAPVVASICRHLDGIALAIELAAARVAIHGIRGTSELLHHRFKLLWQGRRSALPRHQTMQAMLDWSYNLLSEDDCVVLARLSVLVGTFTLEAAQYVAGDARMHPAQVAMSLESLAEKSLLLASSSTGGVSYRILEITKAYAADKLESSGELAVISNRHTRYCCESLGEKRAGVAFPDSASLIGNLRASLEWSLSDCADEQVGVLLAARAVPVFRKQSRLSECAIWSERALARLHDETRGSAVELTLLEGFAVSTMFARGNQTDVPSALERGLAVAAASQSHDDELRLLSWLHIFRTRRGEFTDAARIAERAVVLATRLGSDGAWTVADWMSGVSAYHDGQQLEAQAFCESALRRSSSPEAARYLEIYGFGQHMRGLTVYARNLWLRGLPDKAEAVARQAIADAETRNHPLAMCIALVYTASVSLWRGDLDTAEQRIDRLIASATVNSLDPFRIVGLALRGELEVRRGRLDDGIEHLRTALFSLAGAHHLILSTHFMRTLAEALASRGDLDDAKATLEQAFQQARENGEAYLLPDVLRAKAVIELETGAPDFARAEDDLTESIALARACCSPAFEVRSAIPLARLYLRLGRPGEVPALLEPLIVAVGDGPDRIELTEVRQILASLNANDIAATKQGLLQ